MSSSSFFFLLLSLSFLCEVSYIKNKKEKGGGGMQIVFIFDSLSDIPCLLTDISVSVLCEISLHILEMI
jgi:hypothetical protein